MTSHSFKMDPSDRRHNFRVPETLLALLFYSSFTIGAPDLQGSTDHTLGLCADGVATRLVNAKSAVHKLSVFYFKMCSIIILSTNRLRFRYHIIIISWLCSTKPNRQIWFWYVRPIRDAACWLRVVLGQDVRLCVLMLRHIPLNRLCWFNSVWSLKLGGF